MNALKTALIALAFAAPLAVTQTAQAETLSDIAQAETSEGLWTGLGGAAAPGTGASVDPGLAASLTAGGNPGWRPMESLRLELEYLYRSSAGSRLDEIMAEAPPADSRSLMANALIDFTFSDWITPYVGVGVGRARVEPPTAGFGEAGRDDVFAYQGIVGLSVPFTDTLSFFADGRYLRSDDFTVGFGTVAPDSHLQSWSATAGLRFTFGGGGK